MAPVEQRIDSSDLNVLLNRGILEPCERHKLVLVDPRGNGLGVGQASLKDRTMQLPARNDKE